MADKRRRKSLSIFRPKPEISIPTATANSPSEKYADYSPVEIEKASAKQRPPFLTRGSRTSVFGSLRSVQPLDEEEKLIKTESKASSFHEDDTVNFKEVLEGTVLHFGEVQSTGSVFRKRSNQYMVLTDSYLVRFKSQHKAAEVFPTLPPSLSKASPIRATGSSIGSYHEMQSAANSDVTLGIPLGHIVAAYRLDDGRPYFTIEVSHLDEQSRRASSMQMQLGDPREAELWLRAIHSARRNLRIRKGSRFQQSTLEYVANVLERERDYDQDHFQVFKVIQRASHRSAGRSSSEDLAKLNTTTSYLVIGLNKIHLVPIPRAAVRSSSTSLVDIDSPMSFGIITLSSISVQNGEDTFQLIFKAPLCSPFAAHLASSEAAEIAIWIRYASEYLRPEWIQQPFTFNVPEDLEDHFITPNYAEEDHKCFDRTLIAYCAAYELDTSRICYSVEYECEDAPCFRLLPPPTHLYNSLELLAVFRALRYNESFGSISMADVDLESLRQLYDPYATDTDSLCTRSGVVTNIQGHQDLPVLLQEIRALALKSKRLRRLNFSHSIRTQTKSNNQHQSCGIPEALVPLCKKSLTNVDWIILNGIALGESDIDYLVDAASERKCHLRALEIGECGLSVHDADVLLSTMSVHESTMEVIDISGAQGRFSSELFQRQIGCFAHIRRLNLTRVQKTAGPEPLIAPETLLTWRLEALHLSQTVMNEHCVESISAYLASPRSDTMRELHVNQCGLTGKDLAIFFRSMAREHSTSREMHVSASENRLEIGHSLLFKTLGQNYGPTTLTMRMMDFEKEHHFRELVQAMSTNTTLRTLDISKASLPYAAGEETCEMLRKMLSENQTLKELDISGEHAHLDAARFGIGLNMALRGLKNNQTLRVLRIEHQGLGLQGANTLAEVLEENDTLLEIHCDNNDINLQSFTMLINALQKNKTLVYMPDLNHDREKSLDNIRCEFQSMDKNDEPRSPSKGGTLKRSFTGGLAHRGHRLSLKHRNTLPPVAAYSDQDITTAMNTLNERWDAQIFRMRRYLSRNYHIANGLPWNETEDVDGRPETAESLGEALARVQVDRTPMRERGESLDMVDEKFGERRPLVTHAFSLPEDD